VFRKLNTDYDNCHIAQPQPVGAGLPAKVVGARRKFARKRAPTKTEQDLLFNVTQPI
jgi:hypothetical protein